MRMVFYDQSRRFHILSDGNLLLSRCPGAQDDSQSSTVISDEWQAKSFIRRCFPDSFALIRLRDALARDLFNATRYSDDHVVREAALRLVSGAWRVVYEEVEGSTVTASTVSAPVPYLKPVPGMRQPVTAPRPAAVARQAPVLVPSEEASPPGSEWPEDADQIAQADTLIKAARLGTPFCEPCAAKARAVPERLAS
ncbi:MAG: hypothetical protein JWR17_3612 [Pseudomonas sp.]|jgi:hypothetical protein|uniref:hypothetical protein n=1 Tax=Pseudomonas sp. TaxID=306 RepID=UPI002626A63E|nr:hypothetical protein [Pseudomonas sp.]MDB6050866.1 hypothetical protein [Pseudomonas sp.]